MRRERPAFSALSMADTHKARELSHLFLRFFFCAALHNTKTQLWFYASSITHNKAFSQLLFFIFIHLARGVARGKWDNKASIRFFHRAPHHLDVIITSRSGRQKLTINLLLYRHLKMMPILVRVEWNCFFGTVNPKLFICRRIIPHSISILNSITS